MIHDTNKGDLDGYLNQLKGKGWAEANDEYRLPPYYMDFQFNTDTTLQITFHKEDVLAWPKDRIPDIPAMTKGFLVQVDYNSDMPDYLQLYAVGLSEDNIAEYGKLLVSKCFTDDGYLNYTKNGGTLNGKKYSKLTIWFENNGDDEWMINLDGE
jgi:hypothetical protein